MGINGLMTLLKAHAPGSFKETDKRKYCGKVVAIDASIAIYQFLAQIRTKSDSGYTQHLVDKNGDVTSHIQGFFSRTINLLENGIKPVFVFDGKPPDLKFQELDKRRKSKKKAENEYNEAAVRAENAENEEDELLAMEDMDKAARRNIHVKKSHFEDVKTLLTIMGVPIVDAPGEAEAQCAHLTKQGSVYATGTEDMDSLTFGSPVVLRKLTMPDSSREKVIEIHLDKVLSELAIDHDQFIDLCILCGCDYCESIKGIGPITALKMIRIHRNIETLIKNLPKRYVVPPYFEEKLETVRDLFRTPLVQDSIDVPFHFKEINKPELIDFLVGQKGFNEERVIRSLDKLNPKKGKNIKVDTNQPGIEAFFNKAYLG
jgi:flap endonuclease-1